MESTRQNSSINAINDVRTLLNELEVIFLMKKQRELGKNPIKRRQSIIF